jgi:hypothetical protein
VAAGREAWLATADGTATGRSTIPSNSLVFFEQGELSHIPCRSRLLTLQALEQIDRAHVTRTRTETTIARTLRLVEKAKQRQRLSAWNDPLRKS